MNRKQNTGFVFHYQDGGSGELNELIGKINRC